MSSFAATIRRSVLFICLATLSFAVTAQDDRARSVLPLNGAFLQFNNGNLNDDWAEIVSDACGMEMNTIIIQYLKLDDAEYIRSEKDPTQRILEHCDELNRDIARSERKMRVFIGLTNIGNWNGGRGKDATETQQRLAKAKTECIAMAKRVNERYGKYNSFFGWYIPLEGDNCYDPDDTDTLRALHKFHYDIANECQHLSYKPVAVSAFFNTENGGRDPAQTARVYTKILKGAGLKYLLVQDGVGERKWDDQVQAKVGPYFESFSKACSESETELWGVAECFRFSEKDPHGFEQRIPLEHSNRLVTQLQVMQAAGAKATVAFEFYAYLSVSPHLETHGASLKTRVAFQDEYRKHILNKRPSK
jgi:hypothetical protein